VFLQDFLIAQLPKITKEGLQEAECLEEEAKVSSLLWLNAFPLELVPLQLLQDHRDSGVETLGAGVFCSFHQAVPGGLQVVVPVGHI
jgi:predicted thioesterase